MTATIKTFSENFPWFIPDGNSSFRDMIVASSRLDINTEQPTTLKEYLQQLPADDYRNYSSGIWADNKVVVVARIGDYSNDTEGEWSIIAEREKRNETLKTFNKKHNSENITESSNYFLGNDDVKKYVNDYKDLLYTFKDFVNIGANPNIRKNISHYNVSNSDKIFNVTYVMPIPKTKKYFEIKLSDLTKTQYDEINSLLQKHILQKTNSTEMKKSEEQEIVYVDENTMGNNFISHALSDPLSLRNETSKPLFQKVRFTKDLQSNNEPTPDYFGPLLTPEGFNYFLNNFDSIHINLNNKSVDQSIFEPSISPPTLIQNNGFHAEIATDYVKKYDADGEGNAQEDSFSQTNNHDYNPGSNYEPVGSGRPRRNRTKLFSQTRSKRPILNAPDNVLNTIKQKISRSRVLNSDQPITAFHSTLPPNPSYYSFNSNFTPIPTSSNPIIDKPIETPSMNTIQNITDTTASIGVQDWLDIYQQHNSSLIKPITPSLFSDPSLNITNELLRKTADEGPKQFNVMEAAEWLTHMKIKMDDEERKKTERFKSYIKQFLQGGKASNLQERGNNGNIMKINKQENILEELKFLMLDYFDSLNFKTQEANRTNTSSTEQSILNATNIFELMEQSSQLVKLNLNMILKSETQEPTKFVKRIVEKQVEKCKKAFGKRLFLGGKQKSPGSSKKSGHRRFMVFTKCMNLKLKQCIKGFSLWLEKGKFFLRPQFKLDRAYENYEIERNLYCLRNYNPSSLGSNPHGVRVRPGTKLNRKSGQRKNTARPNEQRIGTRFNKLKNWQHGRKFAKTNIERNRRLKQQRIPKQQLTVQRYTDKQGEDAIKQQN